MIQLTLLTKIQSTRQLKLIEKLLKASFEELNVETEVVTAPWGRWVQVTLSGEDEAIATNFLRKELGLCPASLKNVEKLATLKGYIVNVGKNQDALFVDIGVVQPEIVYANIPLRYLQATLADGRRLALKRIVELFGFCNGMPINVKVTAVKRAEKVVEAELANGQFERFTAWRESLLDKLIVLGAAVSEVKRMLKYTGLDRDIITIESLGMFEQALTCKLGTDAAGLISRMGSNLRTSRFVVFNPRRIKEIMES